MSRFDKARTLSSAYYASVGHYRLHYLDGFRADVVRVREFEAESDEEAIAYSDAVRSLTPMELWEGDRRVSRWGPFPPGSNL